MRNWFAIFRSNNTAPEWLAELYFPTARHNFSLVLYKMEEVYAGGNDIVILVKKLSKLFENKILSVVLLHCNNPKT